MTKTNDKSKQAVPVVLGIDLGKNTIHVHGVDAQGRPCLTRKLTPGRLRTVLSNLPPAGSVWRPVGEPTRGVGRLSRWAMTPG